VEPRDPQGIRMEEARGELRDDPEPALPSTTAEDPGDDSGVVRLSGIVRPDQSGSVRDPSASVREKFRVMFGGGSMGDASRAEFPQAQDPSVVTQQPGMGSADEELSPDDPSIQTIGNASDNSHSSAGYPKVGNQQWSGGGTDSDEVTVPAGEPQGSIDDVVAAFQRSAGIVRQFGEGASGPVADGDIALAARRYLSKTADALPAAEAEELIGEGRGQRARNLGLLRLEGTHYEDEMEDDDDLALA
jgi:hypothetical protein